MSLTFGNCQPVRWSPRKLLLGLPWRALASSLPGLVVFGLALHYYWDFVSDDAYISFRYAEHLATGRGLEWNPDYRVEGYTNFLWVALIAVLRVFGAAAPNGARALAWLAAGATVVLIVLISRRQQPERPSWTLLALAPLPLALTFPYQYWTALRLETPLFSMLMLLATYLFVREEDNREGPQWPSAVAYLAMAMTRPEGAAFIAVPGIYLLSRIRPLTLMTGVLRRRLVWLSVYVGGMLTYHLWRLAYFGDIFPNTYYAKVHGPGRRLRAPLRHRAAVPAGAGHRRPVAGRRRLPHGPAAFGQGRRAGDRGHLRGGRLDARVAPADARDSAAGGRAGRGGPAPRRGQGDRSAALHHGGGGDPLSRHPELHGHPAQGVARHPQGQAPQRADQPGGGAHHGQQEGGPVAALPAAQGSPHRSQPCGRGPLLQ